MEPEFKVEDTNTPQEPTDPDWNKDKTPQKGPTQNWLMTLAASTSIGKSLKEFGPTFRLLKGTRLNYDELEYDFEECYKRDQRKIFYAYARSIQSRGDVYSTKRILTVTHVSVMRKHGYRYLEEIMVRKADKKLYKFKKGDFLRLQINDIKDMLLLVVQNHLINLSGDDVADFAIVLRMFTRSLVIQKRVEDL
nr:hypothetical protein [Tanacetum cinerariifolium]